MQVQIAALESESAEISRQKEAFAPAYAALNPRARDART